MKRIFLVSGFLAILALFAAWSEFRQQPDLHCAYDGSPILPINKVVVTIPGGDEKQFCSVCCAGFWFDNNPEVEDQIEGGAGHLTLVDAVSGVEIDGHLAYWIESSRFSLRENECQVHVFKDPGDAARHLLRYAGQEKPGYLAGQGRELPWAGQFKAANLAGKELDLAGYRGQVVFLRFWNSTNPMTKLDLGYLAEAHRRWQQYGFTVLAVNVEQKKETVKGFIRDLDLPFPVLLDPQGKIADQYGINGFPTGFLIDQAGIIRNQSIGEILPDLMEPLISPLLLF
jgi:peroxiredoxin